MYTNYIHIDVYIVFVHLDLLKIPFFCCLLFESNQDGKSNVQHKLLKLLGESLDIVYFFLFFTRQPSSQIEHSKDLFLKASSKSPASLIQSA